MAWVRSVIRSVLQAPCPRGRGDESLRACRGELSAAERQVLDAIGDHQILEDLRELVAIPSVGGTPAEARAQDWCGERLRGMGLAVDQWDIDVDAERRAEGFPGMEVEREGARGCVAVLGGGAAPRHGAEVPALALCGHTDVVPTGDLARWAAAEPFQLRVEDGTAFGRGACDMKGGLAAVLGAVGAVAATGLELADPWRCTRSAARRTGAWARSRRCGAGTGPRPASSPSRPAGRWYPPMLGR